jgi:hypothetical protein
MSAQLQGLTRPPRTMRGTAGASTRIAAAPATAAGPSRTRDAAEAGNEQLPYEEEGIGQQKHPLQDRSGAAHSMASAEGLRASLKRDHGDRLQELQQSFANKRPKQELSQRASAALQCWWSQHFVWPYPDVSVRKRAIWLPPSNTRLALRSHTPLLMIAGRRETAAV